MHKVRVELGERSYDVLVGSGLLGRLGELLLPFSFARKLLLVTDSRVGELYGGRVRALLEEAGYEVAYYSFPEGEESKSRAETCALYDFALEAGLERRSAVLALGGGVVGDLAGFFAATFMRGLPLVQVPTTLLAQVDSAVGGKVAVNHPRAKNMIGCFYQPCLVCADVDTLRTLAPRELRSGLAEVIKYGVILDGDLFALVERELEALLACAGEVLARVVARCCHLKARLVEEDERDFGRRALLNFGHTVGHALEVLGEYRRYTHGEAVAAGMAVAAGIAADRGLLGEGEFRRLLGLLARAGLPTTFPFPPEEVLALLPRDKKVLAGRVRFVLPLAIGRAAVFSDVASEEIRRNLQKFSESSSK